MTDRTNYASGAYLREWERWMRASGMSPRTFGERTILIVRFEAQTGADSLTVDWRTVADFLAQEGFSAGTRSTYYARLHSWFKWLVLMDYRVDDPMIKIKPPREPRRKPRPLTIDQLSRLLSIRMHTRTRVMILLGAYQGMRVTEIGKVRGRDFCDGQLRVIGKGGTDELLPVHPLVADAAASMPSSGFWFPSFRYPGEPIKGISISYSIGQAMRRAAVPGTPHALRHFYGTEVLRAAGGNLIVAQQLMRHASVATTQGYVQVDSTDREAAVLALPRPRTAAVEAMPTTQKSSP